MSFYAELQQDKKYKTTARWETLIERANKKYGREEFRLGSGNYIYRYNDNAKAFLFVFTTTLVSKNEFNCDYVIHNL